MDKGAHYHRSDLQVHSPRDLNWKGPRPTDEAGRRRYAERFVAACREKGIGAVAITDHHDLVFFEFIRQAAAAECDRAGESLAEAGRLVVFPGIELTLPLPCQALLLLDPQLPADRLEKVLTLLGVEDIVPSDPRHGEPKALEFASLRALHERLDSRKPLRGRYLILPNVTERGHKTLLGSSMQGHYKDIPCVGGYVDGDAAKLGAGARTKLAGLDPEWGETKLAVVQTSDSRGSTFEALGRHSTWIKWASPSAEALRQACLAEESRISLSEPELPSVVITGLRVSNSKFMGPFELELNPQYNALIGGRGTGKSSCLEYLRWGLCDQAADAARAADLPDHAKRQGSLVELTLEPFEASVEVGFEINGIAHLVRRESGSGEVRLKVGEAPSRAASAEEIRNLLAVEAYSQRQLSVISIEVEELTRFVEAPIREQLEAIRARTEAKAEDIRSNFAALQRRRTLTRDIERESAALESLDQQIARLREDLGGLSEADRERLGERPRYDASEQLVADWVEGLAGAREEVGEVQLRLNSLQANLEPADGDLAEAALLVELRGAVMNAVREAQDGIDAAAAALEAAERKGSEVGKLRAGWSKKLATYLKRYTEATKRSSAHAGRLEQLAELEARRRELSSALAGKRKKLAAQGDPEGRDRELRAEWHDLHRERSALIAAQCERLNELSGGLIRATLRRQAASARIVEALRGAFRGTGIRAERIEGFVAEVGRDADPLAAWQGATAELDRLLAEAEREARAPAAPTTKLGFFGAGPLAKVVARVEAEQVLGLSLIALGDEATFEYRTSEGTYIDFALASAGQQATALLGVLLNQDGPPLLIDQPEDDLDSQVIEEIVAKIWQAKCRRQLIFASHNANLVVNGDAELVACFDYRRKGDHSAGMVSEQGAIDIPKVKDEITRVMEGGEKAFRLRKAKYGF